jgi:hypothetical protein
LNWNGNCGTPMDPECQNASSQCFCPCYINGVQVSCYIDPSTTMPNSLSSYVGTWIADWGAKIVIQADGSGTYTQDPQHVAQIHVVTSGPGALATITSGAMQWEDEQHGPGSSFSLSSYVASPGCIGVSVIVGVFADYCS